MLPVAQQLKDRKPILVDDDRLAVNEARLYWQAFHRLHDAREAVSEVVAVASIESDAVSIPAGQDPEAVVLDLVNPAVAGRRYFGRSGQAWLNGGLRKNIKRHGHSKVATLAES
jgi:hypothetical protein